MQSVPKTLFHLAHSGHAIRQFSGVSYLYCRAALTVAFRRAPPGTRTQLPERAPERDRPSVAINCYPRSDLRRWVN
jgi:hypothetical protein